MVKARDLMVKDVRTCRPDDTLAHAARMMAERDCGCLPVVRADGTPLAMITDRDLCMAAYKRNARLADISVESVMSTQVWTCRPETDVNDAERLMSLRQVRRLPVVNGQGRLVGILALSDVAREVSRERGRGLLDVTGASVAETLAGICQPRTALVHREPS